MHDSPMNQAAAEQLRKAGKTLEAEHPAVLQLARWGLENGAPLTSHGQEHRDALEENLNLLLAADREYVMWAFRDHDPADEADPEGLQKLEEIGAMNLRAAESPEAAASLLLDRLMDSLELRLPSLRP